MRPLSASLPHALARHFDSVGMAHLMRRKAPPQTGGAAARMTATISCPLGGSAG